VFFYYKRINSLTVPGIGSAGGYPTANYVIPLPLAETQFGN